MLAQAALPWLDRVWRDAQGAVPQDARALCLNRLALAAPAWQLATSAQFSAKAWAAVVVLGLVHTAWMYTLMYAAFQRLSAQAIAGLSFIYPVVAVLVDLLWFGHHPAPVQALGMVLILLAVWAYRRPKK